MIDFYNEAKKYEQEMIDDIKRLCDICSELDESTAKEGQPFGIGCRQALNEMLSIGVRDGYEVEDVDGYAGHIDIGEGDDTFGILGHLDVVPCNDVGWDTDPYDMEIIDGKMIGRGVADDKGPLIAGYYAAKIIHQLDLPVKKKMRIIFGCNEENGSECMRYYFKKKPFPDLGFTPDAEFPVVYGEKAMAGFEMSGDVEKDNIIGIYAGTVSNIVPEKCEVFIEGQYKQYKPSFEAYLNEFDLDGKVEEEGNHARLVLIGKSAHASTPELGKNAIVYMCHYLVKVSNNKLVHFIDKYFFDDNYGEKLGIAYKGALGRLTVNLGILTYKKSHATMTLDMRLPHEVTDKELTRSVHSKIEEIGLEETHHYTDALYIDPESDFIQTLHNAYVEFTGDHVHKPQSIGGGTYAKSMPHCVGFGVQFPGRDNKIHQNNEEFYIEDLLKSTAIYAKAIYDLIKE